MGAWTGERGPGSGPDGVGEPSSSNACPFVACFPRLTPGDLDEFLEWRPEVDCNTSWDEPGEIPLRVVGCHAGNETSFATIPNRRAFQGRSR
jgi:hypothetical protein